MDMVIVMGVLIMSMVLLKCLWGAYKKDQRSQETIQLLQERVKHYQRDTSQRTRQSDFHIVRESMVVNPVTLPPSRKVEELLGRS